MEKLYLQKIISTIKERGLTAYEISKNTSLSEVGIKKILSGTSKNPRDTTLLILQDYLFGSAGEQNNNNQNIDQLREITIQRKRKGLTWNELADGLPVSGEGIRIAFKRGKVQPEFLSTIRNNLNLNSREEDTINSDLIDRDKIPSYIVQNEHLLLTNKLFNLWLSNKIQEGVIKALSNYQIAQD